ncbi:transposase [Okeania sp. SIO2C9]|uniref:transposase n=1 Tax=Okeania sp. SIO2C9 TaxID=2607791 RepID=UPI0025FAB104|nr:transposase [Okeania sp. SIO2C9]
MWYTRVMSDLLTIDETAELHLVPTKTIIMKSFKTKLKLNNQQKTILAKHAGVARHAYNWGLATCIQEYEETKKRPSAITLHKRLVAEVKSVNPWYYEVSKCAPQQALRDLERAFKNFLTIPKRGFPVFKKKVEKTVFT